MDAVVTTTTVITLTLTLEESAWLRALVQNPINCVDPEEEEPLNREMRQRFWNSLLSI